MNVRGARPDEADAITAIARASKAHWGYSPELLERWKADLAYTPDDIRRQWVTVAESGGDNPDEATLLGVCSLECFGEQLDVSGLWVSPEAMGRGVGRTLLRAALDYCRLQQVNTLRLLSDPHAQGFYETMGATLIGHERGSPDGRLLPLLHFRVSEQDSGLSARSVDT